ncbi:MAG: tyrosyl-tRNA synthetase [Peltula sp. TS41687]|nr:MAG: tyrosyl-tRNA synthetase [Peltula sp. TS41687]
MRRVALVASTIGRSPISISKRTISQNYLRKEKEAEEEWQAQARLIRQGEKKSMLTILEERGYVHEIAGTRKDLDWILTHKRVGAYVGIDPTAASLHIGHLLPLMALFWLYVHGYRSVSLLGAATARIGDPTDRLTPREKQQSATRKENIVRMHLQLKKLWLNVERHVRKYGYIWEWAWRRELCNNNVWLNKLSIMDFMKELGVGVRLGPMLGRETVRRRMEEGEGMSFAEFTYPLLQSWDWWYMYQTKGVQLQIGGSDQLGNITAGMDNINYIRKTHPSPEVRQEKEDRKMAPWGFTVPLLTTSSGEKVGKSAGNAIWLDQEMTSSFDLYQYFLRLPDADVERYLKLFTFLPTTQIGSIMTEHEVDPRQRKAQHVLAREFVEMVHNPEDARKAELEHRSIFRSHSSSSATHASPDTKPPSGPIPVTSNTTFSVNVTLPESLVHNQPPARVLYFAGLVSSRSEGHRLAQSKGAYIGSSTSDVGKMGDSLSFVPVSLWDPTKTKQYLIDGSLLILRVGKWKVRVVKVISDEEFERLGLDAPGWEEEKHKPKPEPEGPVRKILS